MSVSTDVAGAVNTCELTANLLASASSTVRAADSIMRSLMDACGTSTSLMPRLGSMPMHEQKHSAMLNRPTAASAGRPVNASAS